MTEPTVAPERRDREAVQTPARGGVRGTCFGFAVASGGAELSYLRGGAGGERFRVEVGTEPRPPRGPLLTVWERDGRRPLEARLYDDGPAGRYRVWVRGSGWFDVDAPGASVSVPPGEEPVRREERLWGIPALLCLQHRGHLPLHAAAVQLGDTAVLLAAPSGSGKTTLAAALAAAGARLLSEDLSPVRLGGHPAVVPGPAMLRLRHDVAGHLSVPGARRLGVDDDRVHLALDPGARGDCRPVPLAAVVLLREGGQRPHLAPVSPLRALPDLWALSYHPHRREEHERCFRQITALVEDVPVLDLTRPLRLDLLEATAELLTRTGAYA